MHSNLKRLKKFETERENLLEEILELTSSKVLEDLLPVWWAIELTEVWLHVSGKNSECGRLTNSVCSH